MLNDEFHLKEKKRMKNSVSSFVKVITSRENSKFVLEFLIENIFKKYIYTYIYVFCLILSILVHL